MNSLYESFKSIFKMSWPMLLISFVLLSSIRLSYCLKHKGDFVLHREVINIFFLLYILCLFQIVTSQDVNTISGGNNFTPFKEMFRYSFGSRLFIKNIVGNVALFLPYGFFVGKYGTGKDTKFSLFLIFLASVSIECTQLAIGRVFDVDDIILNVLGGIIGYLLYLFISKVYNILPNVLRKDSFLNIIALISLILLIILIIFLSL